MTMDHPRQSLLADELANVIDTLHSLFDELGLARHERESREASVYAAISAALHDQVRVVSHEKTKMVDECHQLISQIKQMERSLAGGDDDYDNYNEDSNITTPLLKCLQGLKEKHKIVKRRHAERYDSVKKLVHALDTYASRLEPSIVQIPLPPATNDSASIASFDLSEAYYDRLEQEFNRVYEEFTRRVSTVATLAKEIINLYAELGIPKAQLDRLIVEYGATEPERLGLSKDDIDRLRTKKSKLIDERERRRSRAEELKREIQELWERLGIEESEKKLFLAKHRGCDMRTIQELEVELNRLLELKRENLHVFVEDARQILQELWDKLYFSEDDIMDFSPAHSDVYTDALLSAHEMEISRLEALLEERTPILALINKHRDLMEDKEQLAASANDSSRLMGRGGNGARDPTRLLREEKMRKRIAKELPRVEVELKKALEKWEDDYGEPLLVKGENYLETLMRLSPVAQSRATATKTPTATTIVRGRSNTMSSLGSYSSQSTQRAKSRPNIKESTQVKPPVRSKTPTARPKTPAGGQLYSSGASTLGRSTGRNLASAMGGRCTPALGSNPALGGRIPQPSSGSISPTRISRPASNDRMGPPSTTSTIGRNASIKRKLGNGNVLGAAPKMQQLQNEPQKLTPYMRHQFEQERREAEEMRSSQGSRSIRSVSPYGSEAHYSTYSDAQEEEDRRDTPRANTYRPNSKNYMDYDSSARGSQTSGSNSRHFSSSTISTISSISTPGNSGSENWETFGEESEYGDDAEQNPREAYYRQKARETYSSHDKSVGLVRSSSHDDEWMSEAAF
ncbi:microtubule associated protein-domain-containing protein [Trichophaea hybrida]|nr:microtubule associated protein-domain-containing protein [Trichophaea hybrida]